MININDKEKKIILEMYGVDSVKESLLPPPPRQTVPFKNAIEGNKFREWVNDRYPDIANKFKLERNSPYYNNTTITDVWNERIGYDTLGDLYKKRQAISDIYDQYSSVFNKTLNKGAEYANEFGQTLYKGFETIYNAFDPKKKTEYDAVLIGGLDNRPGDLSIDQQVQKFKIGYGNKKVKGFRYNTPISEINNFMEKNPKIPIFMFSAGCKKSYDLTNNKNVDKNKLFVIEPYAADYDTKNIIKSAVDNGITPKHVFVGPDIYRGLDVVADASSSRAVDHWSALNVVGQMKSNVV